MELQELYFFYLYIGLGCSALLEDIILCTLCWSSGYDARLTRERSPAQSRDEVFESLKRVSLQTLCTILAATFWDAPPRFAKRGRSGMTTPNGLKLQTGYFGNYYVF